MDSISSRYAACAAVRSASRPLATNVAMAVSSAVARVCSEEVPIPYAKHMEEAALPQVPKIVATVKQVLGK